MTTGIRSWMRAIERLEATVRMAPVSTSEPSGDDHVSIRPAKAITPPLRGLIQ